MENINKPYLVESYYCDPYLAHSLGSQKFAFEQQATSLVEPNVSKTNVVNQQSSTDLQSKILFAETVPVEELIQRVHRLSSRNVRPILSNGKLYFSPFGEDVDVRTAIPSESHVSSLSEETLAIHGDENCESLLLQELNALQKVETVKKSDSAFNVVTARDHDVQSVVSTLVEVTAKDVITRDSITAVEKAKTHEDLSTSNELPDELLTAREVFSDLHTTHDTLSNLCAVCGTSGELYPARDALEDVSTAREAFDDLCTAVEVPSDTNLSTVVEN